MDDVYFKGVGVCVCVYGCVCVCVRREWNGLEVVLGNKEGFYFVFVFDV